MSNIIDSIRMSGTTYAISDSGGTKVVEITQSDYDNLPTSAKTANIMYVITDAEPFDVSNYYTKDETSGATELATAFAATQPKLSAGTNITIDANNVISAEGGGGGGIDSGTVQTMIDQSISGKTNQTDFVSHSGNTSIHVTAQDKTNWNNKSDFSGSYNDLSNKPTIPTSASQLTNDSGYITSSALNGYATEDYVTAATNDMATKTWVGQQGYLTQHQDISGKQDVSGMTAYTTTATTNTLSGTVTAHTADTTIHVTAQDKTNWNNKSDFSGSYNDLTNKLSAGTNISIVDNVISAEGGGSITIDPSLDSGSTNAVANSAITNAFNTYTAQKNNDNGEVRYFYFPTPSNPWGGSTIIKNFSINGRCPLTKTNGSNSYIDKFSLVETSAITTSVTSSSTDVQVPSAKAVNDKLGGLSIVKLSQSEYDSLATKDNSTLYVIVN